VNAKKLFFTVTNDLTYDQRMHRICHSLSGAGYDVTLVGRKLPHSIPLEKRSFKQVRLPCWNVKGKLFYAEYNLRLYYYLSRKAMDGICAIDLDTILPCLSLSKKKSIPRIYDAHEFFTELKEVRTRPLVYKSWMQIEKSAVPQFRNAYTVSESLAQEFQKRYHLEFETIRNLPVLESLPIEHAKSNFIFYQGAVNEGRKFESLIPAMKNVDARLVICGDGNFMPGLRELVTREGLENKIELKGMMKPAELRSISSRARVGVCLSEKEGLNQYLALPNKFLDYIHAGLPQVAMDFPEYRKINEKYPVALLLKDATEGEISEALNKLLYDDVLYAEMRTQTLRAREILNWQEEEKKLLAFYKRIFTS
jgi:glycosyltransferase involved in cell wall biosynthesis